jgi:hypothetical protein
VRRVDRTQVQADAKPHIGSKSVCLQFPCSSSRVRTGQKPPRTPPLPALLVLPERAAMTVSCRQFAQEPASPRA